MRIENIEIDEHNIPKHIAFIMDGNRRWAKQKNIPILEGHRRGITQAVEILETCEEIGVGVASLFTFSKENWNRSEKEIQNLFYLLRLFYETQFQALDNKNMKIISSGDLEYFPFSIKQIIKYIVNKTSRNTGLIINLALNYSGQMEIINAVKNLLRELQNSKFFFDKISEEYFNKYLFHPHLPFPDLLIRTSGEMRISNFFLWQIAYTELYFTDILWPDFGKSQLLKVILEYQRRERRFGADQRVNHE